MNTMSVSGERISPYKSIFDSIVAESYETTRLEPHQAYRVYDDSLVTQGLDPVLYFSMAYTSGGAARDTSLSFGDIIGQNTQYADLSRAAFLDQYPQFSEPDIVVPSDLGKVKGWSQADFLLFWNHVIVGLEPDDATRIDAAMTSELANPAFYDKSLTAEEKWDGYRQFGGAYVDALTRTPLTSNFGPNNMQSVITILDKEATLGGREEEYIAIQLGIKAEQLMLSQRILSMNQNFSVVAGRFGQLGASAMGQRAWGERSATAYMAQPHYTPNLAVKLGFRKTGLINAIIAAEYYAAHPGTRPARHTGHRPLTK